MKRRTGSQRLSIGVDLGGTGTRIALVGHPDGTLVTSRATATAQIGARGGHAAIADLADTIRQTIEGHGPVACIGIGASGPVNPATGIIDNPHTLPWFTGIPITGALAQELDLPVTIDNDAVAAGLGEYTYGAAAGTTRALAVTLGTGIGVALVDHGRPFRGGDGSHPEAGHIPIADLGPPCYCGQRGCWEALASRTALDQALAPHWPANTDTAARRAWLTRHAAEPAVADVLARYGRHVGAGLASLQAVYQPQVTVLGGAAAEYLCHYAPAMEKAMHRNPPFTHAAPTVIGKLGDWAGAIGASLLATVTCSSPP